MENKNTAFIVALYKSLSLLYKIKNIMGERVERDERGRQNQSTKGTEMTDSIRNSSKKILNLYKTFTRRTPKGIMDGLIREVNQKINLSDDASTDS